MFSKSAPLIMPIAVINLQFSAALSAGAGLFWNHLKHWLWTATVLPFWTLRDDAICQNKELGQKMRKFMMRRMRFYRARKNA